MSLLNKIWRIEYNMTITEQKYELLKINCMLLNIATIRQPYPVPPLKYNVQWNSVFFPTPRVMKIDYKNREVKIWGKTTDGVRTRRKTNRGFEKSRSSVLYWGHFRFQNLRPVEMTKIPIKKRLEGTRFWFNVGVHERSKLIRKRKWLYCRA